ncbi:MAG: RnfABCDGE type electron transport complex subunit D [Candidatus Daviesbacteria bacterium]|nr:MAG: RnfABCDGE type electron transport complex subunit D [Candidatus Daviesbacteria bacterium]
MLRLIDAFLNGVTMYRLMMYVLSGLLFLATIFSFFQLLPFAPLPLIFTSIILSATAYLANEILAKIFQAPANFESIFITSLILSLIISPINSLNEVPILMLVAVLAASSKFILALHHKHIFNPAALAIVLVPLLTTFGPSWWVGEPVMLAPTLIGGFLIVRKIKRWDLVLSFLAVFSLVTFGASFLKGADYGQLIRGFSSSFLVLFFATVMLTEPQTTPPVKAWRILYGSLVGAILGSNFHLGPFYTTPELSLILGNIFSFLVSPKEKLILPLQEKIKYSPVLYDFVFKLDRPFNYLSGQFMEWTYALKKLDSRGNRRFFTLASSPTEETLRIGVRFSENGSAFKAQLLEMKKGEKIVASLLSGNFTLPSDLNQKLTFLAGGVGITPFRSMVKYLLDKQEKRDIILLYCVKTNADAIYLKLFNQAKDLGVKTVVKETDKTGVVTKEVIASQIPDFKERLFYLSGPYGMVTSFKKVLSEMGIPASQIKTDYFPGYV